MCAAFDLERIAGPGETFGREFANGLQQPVTRTGPAPLDTDQRAVDQRSEDGGDVGASEHGHGVLGGEGAGEHGETGECRSLLVAETCLRPLEDRGEGLVTSGRVTPR